MALLGGLGGGITRDVLVAQVPSALTNPAYILLALAFGTLGYFVAYAGGQLFREGLFQFMTSFSLPWYAIMGAYTGVKVGLRVLGCLFLGVVGPTAGRFYIDITSGVTPNRWVVERTFAWLHSYKRLLVRYDRRHEIHEAFLAIGCCLVCFRRLSRSF